MKKTELLKERDKMIVSLARGGKTANELGFMYNISVRRIMEILAKAGIKGVVEAAEAKKPAPRTKGSRI